MADGDSDSDSSYVLLSDVTSVGSDSENYVIVGKDNYLCADSDEDFFGGSQNEVEKVLLSADSDEKIEEIFGGSQNELETVLPSPDSDEELFGGSQNELETVLLSADSDEELFGGSQNELEKVVDDEFCDCQQQLEKNGDADSNGNEQIGIQRIYSVIPVIFKLFSFRHLMEMKLVSKEWNMMAKSEWASRCVSSIFVANLEDPGHVAAIRFDAENNFIIEKFQVSDLKSFNYPVIILGSCRSRVCLGDKNHKIILVIDVSTKQCWKIEEEETEDIGEYGFGYDTIDEDYKIIKVYSIESTHAAIFSQKRGAWRDLTFPELDISFDGPGCSIEHRIYWHDTSKDSLVGFDLSKETFDMIELPKALQNDNHMTFGVVRELNSEDAAETLLVCIYEYKDWGEKKWSELWKLTKEQKFEKLRTVVHNEGVMKPLCYHLYPMTIIILEAKQKIKLHHITDDSQTDVPCFGSLHHYPRIDAIGFLDSHEFPITDGCLKGSTSELHNSEITKLNGKDGRY